LEIWVPYGEVESLLTLQAENMGELIDPTPEGHTEELAQILRDRSKGHSKILLCDERPGTLKLIRSFSQFVPQDGSVKLFSTNPKAVESAIPELKGRVLKVIPPAIDSSEVMLSPELADGDSFVIATGEPDPLLGYVDARAAAALLFSPGSRRAAYESREGDTLRELEETRAHHTLVSRLEGLHGTSYATVVTRGGEPYALIEGGAKDARAHFSTQQLNPAKGVVVGAGGRGYDNTFSNSLRLMMGALKAVRKGGDILLVAECRDGIGSEALQMQAEKRLGDGNLRKAFYADGMEELGYLSALKEDYSVTMLTSLPDLYSSGRFGFKTAKNASEALQKVFSSAGRGAKLHVITRAPETLLS